MGTQVSLAERAMAAAVVMIGRSLRLRGFVRRDHGFSRQVGAFHQLIWIDTQAGRDLSFATVSVVLGLVRELPASGIRPQPGQLEAVLWDLIPGRERGGAWTVTSDSALDVVVADIVAALERYGVAYLDALGDDREAGDGFSARAVHRRSAAWRLRRVNRGGIRDDPGGTPRRGGAAR